MSAYTARGFTPGQQKHYRPLVDQAWAKHCERNPAVLREAVDKAAARGAWYEEELKEATGKPSTSFCDRKRDFTKAMAHFEAILGESIFWQMRLYGDDARRIVWNIQELVRVNEVDEQYMRGIARRMLRLDDTCPLPPLEAMEYEQLLIIMGELKRFLRRGGKPGVHQHQHAEDPF